MNFINNRKNTNNKKDKQTSAFTLVETIIVIAIIGILLMLGSPRFKDYIDQAKLTQIKGNIKTVEGVILADKTNKTINDKDIDNNLTENQLKVDKLILKDSEYLSGDKVFKEDFIQIKEEFIKNNTSIRRGLDKFYFNKNTNKVGFLYKEDKNDTNNQNEPTDKLIDVHIRYARLGKYDDKTFLDDIEIPTIIKIDPTNGIKSRVKGLTGGFNYANKSKVYIIDKSSKASDELIYEYTDSLTLLNGDLILEDNEEIKNLSSDKELWMIHYYF